MATFRLRAHVEGLLVRTEHIARFGFDDATGRELTPRQQRRAVASLTRRVNRGVHGLVMRAFRRGRWVRDLGVAIGAFAGRS